MTELWSERAQAYVESDTHREGRDLDLLVSWAEGRTALDVATGGGHVARRLREAGFEVTTLDPAPGMRADVLAPAEHIPFADGSFDTVATRIAPHHFSDVRAAVAEMARVARRLVLVEDTLYDSERIEEAERLHDPTHLRCYSEQEWRSFLEDAGLAVEEVVLEEKRRDFEAWCDRTGCFGADRERARELLGDRIGADGGYTDTKILLRARKRGAVRAAR
jgi:SAM-dependent methyltransferase